MLQKKKSCNHDFMDVSVRSNIYSSVKGSPINSLKSLGQNNARKSVMESNSGREIDIELNIRLNIKQKNLWF
jgi:hypothetical protein